MNPIAALAVALLLSLASNGFLAWAYLGQRDATTAAREQQEQTLTERNDARVLSDACNKATQELRTLADQRQREADAARQRLRQQASAHEKRADAVLAVPAAVPGDACASAQAVVADWLSGRGTP